MKPSPFKGIPHRYHRIKAAWEYVHGINDPLTPRASDADIEKRRRLFAACAPFTVEMAGTGGYTVHAKEKGVAFIWWMFEPHDFIQDAAKDAAAADLLAAECAMLLP